MDRDRQNSTWTATSELRWAATEPLHPQYLQQKWADDNGGQEWRTVPHVFVPGYDPDAAPKASSD